MRFQINSPMARVFALAAATVFAPPSFAQDHEQEAVVPEATTTEANAADTGAAAAEEVAPPENPTPLEVALMAGGVPPADLEPAQKIIYENLFRVSRTYVRPVEMEELEKMVIDGVNNRINNRADKLAEAEAQYAEKETALETLRQELQDQRQAGADEEAIAEARDNVIEAEDALEFAATKVRKMVEYQELDTITLVDAALDYALAGLDPHSDFTPASGSGRRQGGEPPQAGIGVVVQADGESRYVLDRGVIVKSTLDPADNTPAFQKEIEAGDLITHVDGEPLAGLLIRDAHNMITGRENSRVRLIIEREGEDEPVEESIRRKIIKQENVTYRMVAGNYGFIDINSFIEDQVQEDAQAAIEDIQEQAGGVDEVAGYVVSVEDNGGGLLTEVIDLFNMTYDGEEYDSGYGAEVAEETLRRNTVVSTKNRKGLDQRFLTEPGDITGGKPMAVLINGMSASASEIYSGNMQATNRAIIVGIDSFGKSTVQQIGPAPNGSGRLHWTISEYYYGPAADTPFGYSAQWKGVKPDVFLPFVEEAGISESEMENAIMPPEDAREGAQSRYSCDFNNAAQGLPVVDPSFIDPRTGEVHNSLLCAVLALESMTTEPGKKPQLSITGEPRRGVVIRGFAP